MVLYTYGSEIPFQIDLRIIFFGYQAENNFFHLLKDFTCQCSSLRRILDVQLSSFQKKPFTTYINILQEEMSGSVSFLSPQKIHFITIAWRSHLFYNHQLDNSELAMCIEIPLCSRVNQLWDRDGTISHQTKIEAITTIYNFWYIIFLADNILD